ncbi:alpha/beta hydrolase [Rurimicrobium arvi]|uniref:Alpha/beta fold hydrolase n=1 Tax=Rurimicrobium arvi TaxID=2049916 RepID=A0ABP8MNC3_9BACT
MEQIILKGKVFPEIIYRKTGSGPALLLVHGFPANPLLWREIIPELSSRYTLLMPDFFAVPGSWMVDGHNSMDMLAEGFAAILDNEKVERTVIIGHSMGGYMGLAFAGKYPSRLHGLSLVHSSPVPDDEARAEGRRKTVAILESGGKRLFLNKMVKALFPDEFNDKHPEVYKRQTEEAIAVDDQSLVAFYRAIMERADTRSVVQGLSCPVQYLIGEKDSLANIRKELAQKSLAKTSFVSIFKNAGHMVMLEEPDAVLATLNRFLSYCLAEGQE